MANKLSSDDRNSLSIAILAGSVVALMLGIHYLHLHLPSFDELRWKNIELFSSHTEDGMFFVLLIANQFANGVNNAAGVPRRLWLSCLIFVAGLAGLLFTISNLAGLIQSYSLLDSLMVGCVGLVFARLFLDGVPRQVWRNLFAKNVDYAGRLLPLAGTLACLSLLGLWGWSVYQRWTAHDYSTAADFACFGLGIFCAFVAGKRRLKHAVQAPMTLRQ